MAFYLLLLGHIDTTSRCSARTREHADQQLLKMNILLQLLVAVPMVVLMVMVLLVVVLTVVVLTVVVMTMVLDSDN